MGARGVPGQTPRASMNGVPAETRWGATTLAFLAPPPGDEFHGAAPQSASLRRTISALGSSICSKIARAVWAPLIASWRRPSSSERQGPVP